MSFRRALMMRRADAPSADLVFYDAIKSDGVAYIDTGIPVVDNTYHLVAELLPMANPSNTLGIYYTCTNGLTYTDATSQRLISLYAWVWSSSTKGVRLKANTTAVLLSGFPVAWANQKVIFKSDIVGTTANLYGASESSQLSISKARANWSTQLASVNLVCAIGSMKTYELQTYSSGGELLQDLKPCTYQGVAGMWDLVSGTFFGNASDSGEFSVSNDFAFNDSAIRYAKVSGNGRTYVILNIADTSAFSILVSIASSANIKVGIQFHKQSNMTSALSKSTDINTPSSAAGSPSYDSGWITAGTSKSANQDNYVDGVVGIILSFAYSTNTASCPTIAEIRQYTTIIADNIESY